MGAEESGAQEMTTTTSVLVVLGAALAVAAVAWVYLRRVPGEEPFHHFRCPGCRRRLRYQARQAGHAGQCSSCGRKIVFPPVSEATD
jgi:hypothetical protein